MNKYKRCGTYMQWNITLAIQQNEVMPFIATWMD